MVRNKIRSFMTRNDNCVGSFVRKLDNKWRLQVPANVARYLNDRLWLVIITAGELAGCLELHVGNPPTGVDLAHVFRVYMEKANKGSHRIAIGEDVRRFKLKFSGDENVLWKGSGAFYRILPESCESVEADGNLRRCNAM